MLGDGCELRHAAAIAGVEMPDADRLAAEPGRCRRVGRRGPAAIHSPDCSRGGRGFAGQRSARLRASRCRPSAARCRGTARTGRSTSDRLAALRRQLGAGPPAGGGAGGATERSAAYRGRPVGPCALRAAPVRATSLRSCGRPLAPRRSPAARPPACSWRRRCDSQQTGANALRSRSNSPRHTRPCFAGWTESMSSSERLAELDQGRRSACRPARGRARDLGSPGRPPCVACRAGARASVLRPAAGGAAPEPLAVAQGMAMVLAGRRADEAAAPLEEALLRAEGRTENWDRRAMLLWTLDRYRALRLGGERAGFDAGRGPARGERPGPDRDLQHARAAQAAARRASRRRRGRTGRAAGAARGRFRTGAWRSPRPCSLTSRSRPARSTTRARCSRSFPRRAGRQA